MTAIGMPQPTDVEPVTSEARMIREFIVAAEARSARIEREMLWLTRIATVVAFVALIVAAAAA